MTDQQIAFWLATVLVIEAVAIGAMCWLSVSTKALHLSRWVVFGLLLISFGLGVQIVRSLHYFEFGRYPIDTFFPWWILKDIGGSILIMYYAFFWDKEKG